MNESCENCPIREQMVNEIARVKRLETAYLEAGQKYEELGQAIGRCSLTEVATGKRRTLRQERIEVGETFRDAGVEYVLNMGTASRAERCLGPFERSSTNEFVCGTNVSRVMEAEELPATSS